MIGRWTQPAQARARLACTSTYPADIVWDTSLCCASPEHTEILRREVGVNWAMCWLGEGAGVAVTAAISVPTLAAANAATQAALPPQLSSHVPLVLMNVGRVKTRRRAQSQWASSSALKQRSSHQCQVAVPLLIPWAKGRLLLSYRCCFS